MTTTTYAVASPSPQPTAPYLTAAEYRLAPTGVDTTNIVKGDPAASEAALFTLLRRASAICDNVCNQIIAATPDTEAGRLTIARGGLLKIHPRQVPLLAVTGIAYGYQPNSVVALTDLSNVWVEDTAIVVPLTAGIYSTAGPLQFGAPAIGNEVYARWSYLAGYPNTTLAVAAAAGGTTLHVTDATGVLPGVTTLTIYDDAQTEVVQVASGYTYGSTTLTLTSPLQHPHADTGISVSAVPPDIKEACIALTSALIKARGSSAIVMAAVRDEPGRKTSPRDSSMASDAGRAREILMASRCRRVR